MVDARHRITLIINPAATRTNEHLQLRAQEALTPHGLTQVIVAHGAERLREAIESAAHDGATIIALLGGDGTIGIAAGVLADTHVCVIPIPGGSTNVLARGLGWSADPLRAIGEISDALARPVRELAIGRVEAEGQAGVFCVNAGIGFDAATVSWVERHPNIKHRLRQGAFAVASFGPGWRALHSGPALTVHHSNAGTGIRAHSLVAACGAPYAYLGPQPLNLLPHAAWDGRLEWVALTDRSPLRAVRLLVRSLTGGGHLAGPGVVGGTTFTPLRIHAQTPFPVQVDGDPFGEFTEVTIAPGGRLRVLSPGG